MAYREIGMWEILEVLRRVARGERQRAIERVTGHSRTTIRRWLRAARKLGWEPGQGEPDEALAAAVAQRVRPGRDEVSPGSSQARLLPHREQIQAWLAPEDEPAGCDSPRSSSCSSARASTSPTARFTALRSSTVASPTGGG